MKHSSKKALTTFYKAISAKGKLAMQRKRANGETMHLAPFGFKNVRVNGRSTVAPDPKTFPMALLALQMRKEGCTLREICSVVAKQGLLSKRGKPIQPNGMHKILRTFCGLIEEA